MNSSAPLQTFADLLQAYRRELDELDAQVTSLLAARFAITRRIGALKAAHGVIAADPLREQAQLERLVLLSAELDLPAEVTRSVFEMLFRFVRANHLAQASNGSESPSDLEPESSRRPPNPNGS